MWIEFAVCGLEYPRYGGIHSTVKFTGQFRRYLDKALLQKLQSIGGLGFIVDADCYFSKECQPLSS